MSVDSDNVTDNLKSWHIDWTEQNLGSFATNTYAFWKQQQQKKECICILSALYNYILK